MSEEEGKREDVIASDPINAKNEPGKPVTNYPLDN